MLEHNQNFPRFKRYTKEIRNFSYNCPTNSSCAAYEININSGVYLLEVWGAKGGDGSQSNIVRPGGAGGYSRGIINLKQTRKMYVMIGGSGSSIHNVDKVDGGNNGGGTNADTRKDYYKASGGGATDIRLDVNDLYHRILVAGGGGGGNGAGSGGPANGGVGGGIEGGKSPGHPSDSGYNAADGTGATQTQGGVTGILYACGESCRNTSPQPNGIFGFGGNITGGNVMGGTGGGGWYGGGAGNGHGGAGGGGSGFVLNQASSVNTPSGYAFTNSNDVYLIDGYTLSGNQNFASPQGNILIGNNGHGYARITLLEENKNKNRNDCFTFNGMRYVHPFAKQYFIHFITHIISS